MPGFPMNLAAACLRDIRFASAGYPAGRMLEACKTLGPMVASKSHALPLLRAFEAVALNCGEMGEKIEALIIPGHKKRTFETTGSKGQNSGMMKDEIGEVRIEQPYTCLNCQRTMRLSPQISKTTFIYFQ